MKKCCICNINSDYKFCSCCGEIFLDTCKKYSQVIKRSLTKDEIDLVLFLLKGKE